MGISYRWLRKNMELSYQKWFERKKNQHRLCYDRNAWMPFMRNHATHSSMEKCFNFSLNMTYNVAFHILLFSSTKSISSRSPFQVETKLYKCKNTRALNQSKHKSEAAVQRCSLEKVFWKYAANLQENTHAEVWFQ